ncbi:MAG: hypothetical protein HOP07_09240 [Bacteriovoracaceae bacterium]|nr:hypothetical protein [Bacteriovoracaceae bacterium]
MSTTKIQPGISTDRQLNPKEISQKKIRDDREFIPEKYKEVAAGMEQQFVEMMLDQMGKTVEEAEVSEGGMGMDYYKSLQKSERAKAMTAQNNLGLQEMILNQIYPKRMRSEVALKQYEAQANKIHHNLPSYKIDTKTDKIEMGKNDSLPVADENTIAGTKEDGGLL